MASLAPAPKFYQADSNGEPLASGKVYTYEANTNTPLSTYSNQAGTLNTNPVILDSAGRADIWLAPATLYKFVVKDSADATIYTVDYIGGAALWSDLVASGGSALIGFLQAGTGAASRTVQAKLRETVSVIDFGAVGDGTTNDWAACQKACDYVQALGGGTVLFPPGYTFRIAANSIVIWGSNVKLNGYGATIYFDNAGGSAGTYGDPITVLGKQNGLAYYSPQVAGTYTSPATYSGASAASKNVSIEGFTITYGTFSSDTINGISGMNCQHVTVKNCVVNDAPQTGFAWVATDNFDCLDVTLENCLVDGSGMQAYRFNSYTPNAGAMTATMINCKSLDTQLTVSSPWAEQYSLPSSAYIRASGQDKKFSVTLINCDLDATVHLLDGYRQTSLRDCSVGSVFALNASPECELVLDNCKIRSFKLPVLGGAVESQIFYRNTSGGKAVLTVKNCTFEAPVASKYSIYGRGFDVNLEDCLQLLNVYMIDWGTGDTPMINIRGTRLQDPGSAALTFAGNTIAFRDCYIYSPISIIQASKKTILAEACRFVVNNSFSTYCIEVTNGNVAGVNNIIEYTNNAYATILFAPITSVVHKSNQYLYAGGTELSYDECYLNTTPASGYWQVTSRIMNNAPSAGNPKAWVCTVAGATGTWVSEGNL